MELEMDRRIGGISSNKGVVSNRGGEEGAEPQGEALSLPSIYVPALTYGHELWVVTQRTRSWIEAAEMSFLCRVAGLSLRDRGRSSDIQRELRVELLILHL